MFVEISIDASTQENKDIPKERENQVNKPIQIRQLSEHETAELMNTAKFNALSPTRCVSCGNTSDFTRQMFWIGGVSKAERNSDSVHSLIAYQLQQRHGVGSVFFKTHRNKFYVDSAVCKQCASTIIEFDIEFTDEALAEISRLTAVPIEQLRREMEAHAERIAKADRKPSNLKNDKGVIIA